MKIFENQKAKKESPISEERMIHVKESDSEKLRLFAELGPSLPHALLIRLNCFSLEFTLEISEICSFTSREVAE